jgi:hypothetical protein
VPSVRLAVPALVLACSACAVVALDVGNDALPATAPPPALMPDAGDASDAGHDATFLEVLAARCAAPRGTPDYAESAADLTARLRGSWYDCAASGAWSAPPVGVAFDFTTTPTYSFLVLDERASALVASTRDGDTGDLVYVAPKGPADAGPDGTTSDAGGNEETIPFDDPQPRNDVSIELVRGGNLSDFRFIANFESNPRRLVLREVGADPASAVFVPVD